MKLILTLTALFVSASLAFAADEPKKPEPGKGGKGDGKRPDPAEMFKKLDTNGDGFLSQDEFNASPMAKENAERSKKMWEFKDANKDGKLSPEEFAKRPEGKGKGNK
jgi:Ca2+-binding EF-hand superfamily protein